MNEYLPLLHRTPLFADMADEEILAALDCTGAAVRAYPADSFLLQAGTVTESMGVLLTGSALIVQEDIWGHRNVMAKLSPGDTFAESFAASPGAVLNLSVWAEAPCRVLRLQVGRLLTTCSTVCPHHSRMIRNLVTVLARKNLQFNEKITHMSKRTTREKLLSYLSSESIRQGSLSFDIPYDRQQLADYLCVERAAMSAELSKLRREGLLTCQRSHFTLIAPPET